MKNILTHNQFLNEKVLKNEWSYQGFRQLIKEFMTEEMTDKKDLDHFREGYYREDYKQHIIELKLWLNKYHNVDLDLYMKNYKSKIYSDDFFTAYCGFLDSLLYSYDNSFPLSGDLLKPLDTTIKSKEYGGDEYVIKYQYGYQDCDLGRKYLLQTYSNLEDFYFDCAKKFPEVINEEFYISKFNDVRYNFSLSEKKDGYSICVFDLNRYYEDSEYDVLEDFIYDIINIFKEIEEKSNNSNFRYEELYNHLNLIIIGFGDINLNEISESELIEYEEKIELQSTAKKYNL